MSERISGMTAISSASLTDLHEVSKVDGGSPTGYTTYKESNDQIKTLYNSYFLQNTGAQSLTGSLAITGNADTIQLNVKAKSGQTADIARITDSTGAQIYFQVTADATVSFLGIVNSDTRFQSEVFRQSAINGQLKLYSSSTSTAANGILITGDNCGVTITPAANKNITLTTSGTGKTAAVSFSFSGFLVGTTRVVTAAGAVTVSATDYTVVVNKSSGAATVVNLDAPGTSPGRIVIIKDGKGDAATNNITLTPASGNIDGASTFVMASNYQSVSLLDNGTQYNIL